MADIKNYPPTQQPANYPPDNNQSGFSATPPIPPPSHGGEWSHSLWDCCSPTETCLFGWCLAPCLYGKTSSRLEDPALKEDSMLNGDCALFYLASCCGCYWCLLMSKTGDLRKRFGIEGSAGTDCVKSYFCPCCTLVQNEKEVEVRSKSMQTPAPAPYQAPQGMAYPQ